MKPNLFEHELRGKGHNPEDELTALVFSVLELSRRIDFPQPFNHFLDKIELSHASPTNLNLKLWPTFTVPDPDINRNVIEPDVFLEGPNEYIWIECKRNSNFHHSQLKLQTQKANKLSKNKALKLVAISPHTSMPGTVQEHNENIRKLKYEKINSDINWSWISWANFHQWFSQLNNDLFEVSAMKFLLESSLTYLEENKMESFTGFNQDEFWSYSISLDQIQNTGKNIGRFIKHLDEQLSEQDSEIFRRYSDSEHSTT